MSNLVLFNLCLFLAVAFIWIFAPILLPVILFIAAGLLLVVNLGFYIVFVWEWLNSRG